MATMTLTEVPVIKDKPDIALGSVDWLTKVIKTLDTWRRREKSRADSARISRRTLQDAGIDSARIFIEGNKPFWEA